MVGIPGKQISSSGSGRGVGTTNVEDLAVTNGKLAANAVTEAKIATTTFVASGNLTGGGGTKVDTVADVTFDSVTLDQANADVLFERGAVGQVDLNATPSGAGDGTLRLATVIAGGASLFLGTGSAFNMNPPQAGSGTGAAVTFTAGSGAAGENGGIMWIRGGTAPDSGTGGNLWLDGGFSVSSTEGDVVIGTSATYTNQVTIGYTGMTVQVNAQQMDFPDGSLAGDALAAPGIAIIGNDGSSGAGLSAQVLAGAGDTGFAGGPAYLGAGAGSGAAGGDVGIWPGSGSSSGSIYFYNTEAASQSVSWQVSAAGVVDLNSSAGGGGDGTLNCAQININPGTGSVGVPTLSVGGPGFRESAAQVLTVANGNDLVTFGGGLIVQAAGQFQFSSNTQSTGTVDTFISRNAAGDVQIGATTASADGIIRSAHSYQSGEVWANKHAARVSGTGNATSVLDAGTAQTQHASDAEVVWGDTTNIFAGWTADTFLGRTSAGVAYVGATTGTADGTLQLATLTRASANLTISTTTSGDITLNPAGNLVFPGTTFNIGTEATTTTFKGVDATTAATAGTALVIEAGDGNTSGNGGNITIDAGSSPSGTAGTITIGGTNPSTVTIGNTAGNPALNFYGEIAEFRLGGTDFRIADDAGSQRFVMTGAGNVQLANNGAYGFSSTSAASGSQDTFLQRNAAGVVEVNASEDGGGDGSLQLDRLICNAGALLTVRNNANTQDFVTFASSGSNAGVRIGSSSEFIFTAGTSEGTSDTFVSRGAAGRVDINSTTGGGGDGTLQLRQATYTDGNGGKIDILRATEELTALSGATAATSGLVPAGAKILYVTARVTTTITGATTFDIGETDVDRWGAAIALTAGTTVDGTDYTADPEVFSASAQEVTLTANGSNFTAGAVRIVAYYALPTAPTS